MDLNWLLLLSLGPASPSVRENGKVLCRLSHIRFAFAQK
jgi:hypothetical protein